MPTSTPRLPRLRQQESPETSEIASLWLTGNNPQLIECLSAKRDLGRTTIVQMDCFDDPEWVPDFGDVQLFERILRSERMQTLIVCLQPGQPADARPTAEVTGMTRMIEELRDRKRRQEAAQHQMHRILGVLDSTWQSMSSVANRQSVQGMLHLSETDAFLVYCRNRRAFVPLPLTIEP